MSLVSLVSLFSALGLCEKAFNLTHVVTNYAPVDVECPQSTTEFKASN